MPQILVPFFQVLTRSRSSQMIWGLITVLLLTLAFGEQFYTQPQLKTGTAPSQTILAPADRTVEDHQQTELRRQQARQITPIVSLDADRTAMSRQQVIRILQEGQRLRQMRGKFPIVPPEILAPSRQKSLLQAELTEWQAIVTALSDKPIGPVAVWQTQTIAALATYRQQAGAEKLALILTQITQARQMHQTARQALRDPVRAESGFFYPTALFELSAADWQRLSQQLPPLTDRILAQGVSPGFAPALRDNAFKLHAEATFSKAAQPIAIAILRHSLEPNLIQDKYQTEQEARQAENNVPAVMLTIHQGDVLAQAGQPITPEQAFWLAYFQLDRRTVEPKKFAIFSSITAAMVALLPLISQIFKLRFTSRDYVLVMLLVLTTPLLILLHVPSTNLPMLGLLLGTFYNPYLSILLVSGVGALLPIGLNLAMQPWLTSLVGGLLAAGYSARLRSREDSVLLGVGVGLLQSGVYLLSGWWLRQSGPDLLGGATIYGLLGMAWCIVGLGISPYLERLFDLVTTLRLVELANLNRPLLKRLAAETPGTFQHTLAVANLAEAAAKELGCNVELVRTGTLYHDIGKMHDPLGFIENQMGGVNKHDLLNNPWESAEIIRKHITEGIAMAKRSGLPLAVQAFIPEHQGNQLITYFYYQAQQQAEANPDLLIYERDFRYAGPNPQSRETGIVMLADSCEAALRSLGAATPEQANQMIQKIFRARWQEGALADAGLTRADLDRIATIFRCVWQQSNHQRIAYPK